MLRPILDCEQEVRRPLAEGTDALEELPEDFDVFKTLVTQKLNVEAYPVWAAFQHILTLVEKHKYDYQAIRKLRPLTQFLLQQLVEGTESLDNSIRPLPYCYREALLKRTAKVAIPEPAADSVKTTIARVQNYWQEKGRKLTNFPE